mmetsp:Transcript_12769/g.26080  ORF Transcript_12769/g.26080 Transcript_12769/m.26080 type:complete len:143 (-) Transcript_12769:320-748(-)
MGNSGKFVQIGISNGDNDNQNHKKYVTYANRTGVMGLSYKLDDQRVCFNPAESYQTGWYSDQTLAIDPLDMDGANTNDGRNTATTTRTHRFVLNGVSDYQSGRDRLVHYGRYWWCGGATTSACVFLWTHSWTSLWRSLQTPM